MDKEIIHYEQIKRSKKRTNKKTNALQLAILSSILQQMLHLMRWQSNDEDSFRSQITKLFDFWSHSKIDKDNTLKKLCDVK